MGRGRGLRLAAPGAAQPEHEEIVQFFTFRCQPCHPQSIAVTGVYCEEQGNADWTKREWEGWAARCPRCGKMRPAYHGDFI